MSRRLATTQWSQVLAARDGAGTEARQTLEGLCQTYWLPLYAYARSLGNDPERAEDLTQSFFAHCWRKTSCRASSRRSRLVRCRELPGPGADRGHDPGAGLRVPLGGDLDRFRMDDLYLLDLRVEKTFAASSDINLIFGIPVQRPQRRHGAVAGDHAELRPR